MEAYQHRVIDEKNELGDRLSKLEAFVGDEAFYNIAEEQQNLLRLQLGAMQLYDLILRQRIKKFK